MVPESIRFRRPDPVKDKESSFSLAHHLEPATTVYGFTLHSTELLYSLQLKYTHEHDTQSTDVLYYVAFAQP